MPLQECMEKHTERQLDIWNAWFDIQWSRPSRTDWYIMQNGFETRRAHAKRPKLVKLKHMILKFGGGKATIDPKIALAYSKARWFAGLGVGRKKGEKKQGPLLLKPTNNNKKG